MSSLTEYIDDYELLTPEEKGYVTNGCGPKFGMLYRIIPSFCTLYTEACNLHDWIYYCGGPMEMRDLADLRFHSDMVKINRSLSWWQRFTHAWVPDAFYSAARWFGKPMWNEAENRKTLSDLKREMEDANI